MKKIRYGARTEEELRNREVEATSIGAWSTTLTAHYETDPEAVSAVLPPPLEPAAQPIVRVTIARVDLGRGMPPFGAGTFAVAAVHEKTTGSYPLVMPMTTEQAVVGGRETFGEPKKIAEVVLEQNGDQVDGWFARMGVRFLEVRGRVEAELEPPPETERTDFYFKFLPSPDGKGFDSEPALVHCHRREQTRSLARVVGDIVLNESRFDPVVDLPVKRILGIELAERNSIQEGEIVTRVPGEWLAPYVHQRYDDLSPAGAD